MRTSTFLVSAFAAMASARAVPANVQALYNKIVAQGTCANPIVSGFYATDSSGPNWCYCGDHLSDYGVLYLSGSSGALADMDIDCDGDQTIINGDTRCSGSSDTQGQTSFEGIVAGYGQGVTDLNSNIHTYVVLGNTGTKSGYVNFDPRSKGVQPLGLVAVVCGNGKMFYGIWGDENGDEDGSESMIGEASISIATMCFGTSMNADNGHDATDVLYLAFTGTDAVPGTSAAWDASSSTAFEASLGTLGDKLVQRIGGSSSSSTTLATSTTKVATSTTLTAASTCTACSWTGHCAAATCSSDSDCDGSLTCISGTCGGCTWVGHCACASCSTANDCDGDLVCTNGVCSA